MASFTNTQRIDIKPLPTYCWDVQGPNGDVLKTGIEQGQNVARIAAWKAAKRKRKAGKAVRA